MVIYYYVQFPQYPINVLYFKRIYTPQRFVKHCRLSIYRQYRYTSIRWRILKNSYSHKTSARLRIPWASYGVSFMREKMTAIYWEHTVVLIRWALMSGHGTHHWKLSFSLTFMPARDDDTVLCWLSPGKVSLLSPVSNFKRTQFGKALLTIWLVVATVIVTSMATFMVAVKGRVIDIPIDQSHKTQNAPIPYTTIHHSEQKCAHFCSEWCIGTDASWHLWIRSIISSSSNNNSSNSSNGRSSSRNIHVCPCWQTCTSKLELIHCHWKIPA